MATRKFTQARWRGEVTAIEELTRDLIDRVEKRIGHEPIIVATLQLPRGDEDHYYGGDGLKALIAKLDKDGFRNMGSAQFQVGRFTKDHPEDDIAVTVTFSASTGIGSTDPAVAVEVSGQDTEVVDGLRTRVAEVLRGFRPRVPAPPFAVTYFAAYFVGAAYGFCISYFDLLAWVPDGLGWSIMASVLLLLSSFALGYLIFWSAKHFIPPLELLGAGRVPRAKVWRGRLVRGGALALAVIPVVFTVIDHL